MLPFSDSNIWGLVLLVAFPLLTIFLSEAAHRMSPAREVHPFRTPVMLLRYSVLPLGFVSILLHTVIGVAPDEMALKIVDTAAAIAFLNAAIAFFNALVVSESALVAERYRVPALLLDVIRVILVLCGAAIVVSRIWGADLSSLVAALGVGSIVIGLALQDTLSSLFAGIAMVSSRQFGIGDWIGFGSDEGQVVAMDWRSVTLRAGNGSLLFIPNSIIAKQQVKVMAPGDASVTTTVEIRTPYDTPPDRISRLITDAARQTPGFHLTPPPAARVSALANDGIVYTIGVRVLDYAQAGAVRGEFLANLWYLAQRRGVVFAGQTAAPTVMLAPLAPAEADEHKALIAKFAAVGGLSLPDDQLAALVANGRLERYRSGETIMDPGSPDDRIFILIEGRAQAVFRDDSGVEVPLHEFERGDLLMARSLFRSARTQFGLKSTADSQVIAIPAADFRAARAANASLARDVEQLALAREEMVAQALRKAFPDRPDELDLSDRARIMREMFRT